MTIRKKLMLSGFLNTVFPTIFVFTVGIILYFAFYGFDNSEKHLGNEIDVKCMSAAEADESGFEAVEGTAKVYRAAANDYIIVFENASDIPKKSAYIQRHAFIVVILVLTILVFVFHRILANHIYKSIITPLDILSDGVNEISNGNMDYRIDYKSKDEFAPVCNAFNEMAERLSEMSCRQQKEEQSRKVLLAGISHDLRTPLTSIKAYVVGFENGIAKTPAMQKKYLDTINQKANQLEYIINQLFLFSKLDVGDFPFRTETVNLGDELWQLVEEMKDEYEQRGVSLEIEMAAGRIAAGIICSSRLISGNTTFSLWHGVDGDVSYLC